MWAMWHQHHTPISASNTMCGICLAAKEILSLKQNLILLLTGQEKSLTPLQFISNLASSRMTSNKQGNRLTEREEK